MNDDLTITVVQVCIGFCVIRCALLSLFFILGGDMSDMHVQLDKGVNVLCINL